MLTINEKVAYAAGFFDGEGCVRISAYKMRNGSTNYLLKVTVKQTNRAPLLFLQEMFGGFITEERRSSTVKRCWVWNIAYGKCAEFLEKVLPALQVKFVEAAIGLFFQETFTNSPGHGEPVPEHVKDLRRHLCAQCDIEKRNNF